jgi:hypothetical protein
MQTRTTGPALADPVAREFLRQADPVLARIIDERPDFRPRAWTTDLPALDAFSTLIFQVIGQQLSVRATRTILGRLEQVFGGRLPTPAEMLAADPAAVRSSGMSTRKAATLRAVAQHFVDGRLSDEALSAMSDEDVVACPDQHPGDRTVDGTRLPARRARPTRRVPDGRPCTPAGSGGRLWLRPSPVGRRDAPAGRTLATVSEPGSELPVRLRIRRTHRCPSLSWCQPQTLST